MARCTVCTDRRVRRGPRDERNRVTQSRVRAILDVPRAVLFLRVPCLAEEQGPRWRPLEPLVRTRHDFGDVPVRGEHAPLGGPAGMDDTALGPPSGPE